MNIPKRPSAILSGTSGESKTRLCAIWRTMKFRIENSKCDKYKHYGGRGITICKAWSENFQPFKEWALTHGYSNKLTIDRINNDGNYEPDNCRWITKAEQNLNKRCKIDSFKHESIKWAGQTFTIEEWSNRQSISVEVIRDRINAKWDIGRALSEPVSVKANVYVYNPGKLRHLIQSNYTTQKNFADIIGTNPTAINHILKHDRGIKWSLAWRISLMLNEPNPSEIFSDDPLKEVLPETEPIITIYPKRPPKVHIKPLKAAKPIKPPKPIKEPKPVKEPKNIHILATTPPTPSEWWRQRTDNR